MLFAAPFLVLGLTFGITKLRPRFPAKIESSISSSSRIAFFDDEKDISAAIRQLPTLLKKHPLTPEFRVYRLDKSRRINGVLIVFNEL